MSERKVTKEDSIRSEDEAKKDLQPHRVLREVLKHYLEFRDLVTSPEQQATGTAGKTRTVATIQNTDGVIDYTYSVATSEGIEKVSMSISFWDLQGLLKHLSPRKREAVFYNVILDKKQKDVAKIMGITTVSVGQYVDQAMLQLERDFYNVVVKIEDSSDDEGSLAPS